MNLDEARKIWGQMMSEEELKGWLELANKIRPEEHDPNVPVGATIELDAATGKHVPDKHGD